MESMGKATAAALVHAGVQGPGRGAVPVRACELLKVARAAYYAVRDGQPSDRDREDAGLLVTTKAEHKRSTGQYGAPRVHAELRHQGRQRSRKRIGRLMRQQGLRGRVPKPWTKTRIPDPAAAARADAIRRDFTTDASKINQRCCGDITTFVYQGAGKLARRKDSRHGEGIPNHGQARVAGHAARNYDHGSGAVGLRELVCGEHTCGEQLTTGEQFNFGEQPRTCQHGLAQSRTNPVAPSAGLRKAGGAGGRQTGGLVEGVLGSKCAKVATGRSRNRDLVQEPRPR